MGLKFKYYRMTIECTCLKTDIAKIELISNKRENKKTLMCRQQRCIELTGKTREVKKLWKKGVK